MIKNIIKIHFCDIFINLLVPKNLFNYLYNIFMCDTTPKTVAKVTLWYELRLENKICWIYNLEDKVKIELSRNENWIIDLVEQVEKIILDNSKMFVMHGGCIQAKNKNVIISAGRNCGKTTLLLNLLKNKSYRFVSDDFVFIDSNLQAQGLIMPMKLRKYEEQEGEYLHIANSNNSLRYFFRPNNEIAKEAHPITAIIAPKYTEEDINICERITGNNYINIMIKNFKKTISVGALYHCLSEMSKKVPLYQLTYNDNEFAYDSFQEIIK